MTSKIKNNGSRRKFLKNAGAAAVVAPLAAYTKKFAIGAPTEIVHWSWLAASDGEVWGKMIDNFNDAHKDKGIQIKIELIPEEQYVTKVLASVATGRAPDFGWGTGRQPRSW
jgi:ABC-type glycerol-3-phosphate transport system substrate-binding protein